MKKYKSTPNFVSGIALLLIVLGSILFGVFFKHKSFPDSLIYTVSEGALKYILVASLLCFFLLRHNIYVVSKSNIEMQVGGIFTIHIVDISNILRIDEQKEDLIIQTDNNKHTIKVSPKDKLEFIEYLRDLNTNILIGTKK